MLVGNINNMQKMNDDDNTPQLFNDSGFIPAEKVISPNEDDPELCDYSFNKELVLWHSTNLNDLPQLVSYLQSYTSIFSDLFPQGFS